MNKGTAYFQSGPVLIICDRHDKIQEVIDADLEHDPLVSAKLLDMINATGLSADMLYVAAQALLQRTQVLQHKRGEPPSLALHVQHVMDSNCDKCARSGLHLIHESTQLKAQVATLEAELARRSAIVRTGRGRP